MMLRGERHMIGTMPILRDSHYVKLVSYGINGRNNCVTISDSQASTRQKWVLYINDEQCGFLANANVEQSQKQDDVI